MLLAYMNWRNPILKWMRAIYIFATCFIVVPTVYLMLVLAFHPLKYVCSRAHQLTYNIYFEWVAAHFGYISETYGSRILIYGDALPRSGRRNHTRHMLIANHQSSCESTMMLAYLGTMRSACRSLWIVFGFKRLRFNPIGIGWWVHGHFFFKRSKTDEHRVKQQRKLYDHISHFGKANDFKYFVVFPEGGFAHHASIKKSQDFAGKQGLRKLNYVLLPRYGAVWQMFRAFNDSQDPSYKLHDIVDLTIIYGCKNKPPSYLDMVFGKANAEEIHIFTQIIPIRNVPTDDFEKCKQWLNEVWYEKEERISKFIKTGEIFDKNGTRQLAREMQNGSFLRFLSIQAFFFYCFYLIVTLNTNFFLALPSLAFLALIYSYCIPEETDTLM